MSVAHRLNRAWILVSIVVLSSCASTQESDLKKSESSRNVGEVYYQQGNFTQALKHFLEAEKLNPDDPELQNNLGLAYMSKDRIDLAIVHFKKALVIKPDFSKVKNNIGVAYLRKKTGMPLFSTSRNFPKIFCMKDPTTLYSISVRRIISNMI